MIDADARSLPRFLAAVEHRVEVIVRDAAPLPGQAEIMGSRARPDLVDHKPLAHPLAPFYFAIRAHEVLPGELAQRLGAGYLLLHQALGQVDDVQDDELDGGLAAAGPAIVTNCSMMLFFLALDTLWDAAQGPAAVHVRDLVRVHGLRLARGQHRDLAGRGRGIAPAYARTTAIEKSAIFTLLIELAGLCGGQDAASGPAPAYRAIGDGVAEIHQLTDDIADLFGGRRNDIHTRTCNVPLAYALEALDDDQRDPWREALPSMVPDELERTLYRCGAIANTARLIESARRRVHAGFVELPCRGPYLALFLGWLDDLVSILYRPPSLGLVGDIDDVSADGLDDGDVPYLLALRSARGGVPVQARRTA